MTPDFRVFANQRDITDKIADRLIAMTVTDEAGIQSDSLTIRLDDRDTALSLPQTGATLTVKLGFKETALTTMGLYTVDEVGCDLSPQTLTITAKAANMRNSLKEQRDQSWHEVTLDHILKTIARRHDLIPKLSPAFATVAYQHIDQTNESDLHFLTRLAQDHDAIAKPVMDALVFVTRGEARSVTGKALPLIALSKEDLTAGSYRQTDRSKYRSVKARWHNGDAALTQFEQIGTEKPTYVLRNDYPNATEALQAARAKYNSLKRGTATFSATTAQGNPALRAEGKIQLTGMRPEINGLWGMTRVTHSLTSTSYTTRLEAETPK